VTIRFSLLAIIGLAGAALLAGCDDRTAPDTSLPPDATGGGPLAAPDRGAYLSDAGGRVVSAIEAGGSLEVGVNGLQAGRAYDVVLTLEEELISFSRLAADGEGVIAPFHLWFQGGVVGCAERVPDELGPFQFRTFDEAETAMAGRELTLAVYEAGAQRAEAAAREPVMRIPVPVLPSRAPTIYPSDAEGCLINSSETGTSDMYVSGRGFQPGQTIEVSVVNNQRRWRVGDPVTDVTGTLGGHAPVTARADEAGRFTINVWPRDAQRRGAFDVIARPIDAAGATPDAGAPLRDIDFAPFASDTALILFLYYPPGNGQMDIAGRPVGGFPYFEFSDAFSRTGDPVWGAVDPTYIPVGHAAGDYAAYYVVDHRDALGWGADTSLTDVTGVVEIQRVKAGCINGTDRIIWNAPLVNGAYDVVVNFGSTPAAALADFVDDFTYDAASDFLDGGVQVGFRVGEDPFTPGAFDVGQAVYNFEDALWLSDRVTSHWRVNQPPGTPTVDLRAVVRYPASSAGVETPVAPGSHPIFLIQHGNHWICGPGDLTNHASCPVASRTPNHEGYMNLLDLLASHGVIAVSIDAFDLTGPYEPQWIEERGDLILAHLEFWAQLHSAGSYPAYSDPFSGLFSGAVDFSRISVSGHSRGGEASVAAWSRDSLRPPANQFDIGSVSSIAPVDALAGPAYNLNDVPYFVILPAADGDVDNLQGARIYDRAGLGVDAMKSGVHIYGANHAFFNTVWAMTGDEATVPRDDFIAANDQQRLGESLLAAFTRIHLTGDTIYENLMRGDMPFPSLSGFKIYYFHHEANNLVLETGAGAGAPNGAITAGSVAGPSVHVSTALDIEWTANTARYTYNAPGTIDVTGFEVLSFRASQTQGGLNAAGDLEFRAVLSDGSDERAIYTGRFDAIPEQYDHPDYASDHSVMTTVRIPLHAFIINNSNVDLTAVDSVELRFSNTSQGEIIIDDIEFSR